MTRGKWPGPAAGITQGQVCHRILTAEPASRMVNCSDRGARSGPGRGRRSVAKAGYDIKAAAAKVRTETNKKEAARKLAKNRTAIIDDLLKPAQPDGEAPTLRRYITTNATYEALAVIMQQNPNGIIVHRDEMLSLLDRLDERVTPTSGVSTSAGGMVTRRIR